MRNLLLVACALVVVWIAGCNHCTADTHDFLVPTTYPANDDWEPSAFADRCSIHQQTDERCWSNAEAHAEEWKALPCEKTCAMLGVLAGEPSSCEAMRKTPDGKYHIKCTWERCYTPRAGTGWGSGNGGEI